VTTPLGPLPVNIPAQTINVPQQNIKLMEQSTLLMSANVQMPLYTGGLRSSLVTQAERGLEVAKHEVTRTDLEIVHDVRRMYHGVVLARELQRLSQEALDRMAVTLELTEKRYQGWIRAREENRLSAEQDCGGGPSLRHRLPAG
jgi:outer membrane protein